MVPKNVGPQKILPQILLSKKNVGPKDFLIEHNVDGFYLKFLFPSSLGIGLTVVLVWEVVLSFMMVVVNTLSAAEEVNVKTTLEQDRNSV